MIEIVPRPIIEQLIAIHIKYELEYKKSHPYSELVEYYTNMLNKEIIVPYIKDGLVMGYFEVWMINFEQFGRIICRDNWNQSEENLTDGNLAYVANTFILPEFRNGIVFKIMRNRFYSKCKHCDYYCGWAIRKTSSQPVKVFKRSELQSLLFNQGDKGDT